MTDEGGDDMKPSRAAILIADDDEDILELVRVRLSRSGYETLLARDGVEALALARERRPDLALLDISMPNMSGYDVAAALKADPATEAIPVILLTARAQPSDVAKGFEVGADDYITKPFSPQELHSRIAAALDDSAAAAARPMTLRPAARG
jgi:DNA-binding response OmpR family regulator